ncbi:MAG: hypothetical protein EXR00_02575 [Alphaproteobacteria bacterium]|nr:hypothetical protein [Alphaproteobacteria bacterium]
MRWSRASFASLAAAMMVSGVQGQNAAPRLNLATAQKMADACVAYAGAHNGAVSIWVYDEQGGVVYFQRMDGALPDGPAFGPASPGFIGNESTQPFTREPGTGASAGDPVILNGRNIGSVQVTGMGATGNFACARVAIDAGVPPGRVNGPGGR